MCTGLASWLSGLVWYYSVTVRMTLILFVSYSEVPEDPQKNVEKNEKDVERITCGKVLRASPGILRASPGLLLIILGMLACDSMSFAHVPVTIRFTIYFMMLSLGFLIHRQRA